MTPQLSEALRNEIRTALEADGQPFDVVVARRVYDLAIAARDMCVAATSGVKEAIATIKDVGGPLESLDAPDTPESQVQASESFGARLLRELLAVVPTFTQQRPNPAVDPEALMLVHALAAARRSGMHDVAAELEKKLFGCTLVGPKPVVEIPVVNGDVEVAVGGYEHGFADGKAGRDRAHETPAYIEGYVDGVDAGCRETAPTTEAPPAEAPKLTIDDYEKQSAPPKGMSLDDAERLYKENLLGMP